jgi:hypothetical protein
MKRLLARVFANLPDKSRLQSVGSRFSLPSLNQKKKKRRRSNRKFLDSSKQISLLLLLILCCCTLWFGTTNKESVLAQSEAPSNDVSSNPASSTNTSPEIILAQSEAPASDAPSNQGSSTDTLRESVLQERKARGSREDNPDAGAPPFSAREQQQQANELKAPELTPGGGRQYVLEFNRSPVVGTRLSLRGIYDEARVGFTRPNDWELKSARVQLRYRHSPALYATRSNLTVLINQVSVGTVPLNRKRNEIGSEVFDIPLSAIQNYNELTVGALQNNSPTCTQDPYDPSLWTEVLPDSKIVLSYAPRTIPLDFNRFPYPVFDELSLEPNRVAYLLPKKVDDTWLSATGRFQANLGRLAEFRKLETRTVKGVEDVKGITKSGSTERLVIIGTPAQQPALLNFKLPKSISWGSAGSEVAEDTPETDSLRDEAIQKTAKTTKGPQILDEKGKPLSPDIGVLVLTTSTNKNPVLIATGNGPVGVGKAVQFLVQRKDRQIGTGQLILVKDLTLVPSPNPRDWPGYLPMVDNFKLSDLRTRSNQLYKDVTVRGSDAPPIEVDFRALPDDKFVSGNSMTLTYSYGPQVNAKTSLVEVKLDGLALLGKRLSSIDGGNKEKLKIALPEDLIKPNSKLSVDFRLDARERRSCSRVTDQQLWGTMHADTSFELKRANAVQLPDLKLLQTGFPFTAPQDMSSTAIVLPKEPSIQEIGTLLEFSKRLGRISKADSLQLEVYTVDKFSKEKREKRHLVGIGSRKTFPFPEVLTTGDFDLKEQLVRQRNVSEIQTNPDNDGVIKEIISPYNKERVLLALTSQTDKGLEQVQSLWRLDPLFFQLKEDTALVSAKEANPDITDANSYVIEFLQREKRVKIDKTPLPNKFFQVLGSSWLLLGPAMIASGIILYGLIQLFLKRISGEKS